jgi:hypothetical protein
MDCGGVLLCDCVLDDSDLLSGVSQWLLGRVHYTLCLGDNSALLKWCISMVIWLF